MAYLSIIFLGYRFYWKYYYLNCYLKKFLEIGFCDFIVIFNESYIIVEVLILIFVVGEMLKIFLIIDYK